MDLYFSPLACSLASRISLYEAGGEAKFIEVDSKAKRTADGVDYWQIYPLGLVPLLRLEDGSLLAENAAILQYIAARYPKARLVPDDAEGRARLQQWLCFIGTELHKAMFIPLFDQKAPEGTRAHVLGKTQSRLKYLDDYLAGREFLLDTFTVADAYLYTVLNWTTVTGVDLARYPAIVAYNNRLKARPSIAKAFAEEYALYQAEKTRQ